MLAYSMEAKFDEHTNAEFAQLYALLGKAVQGKIKNLYVEFQQPLHRQQ